MPEIFIPVRGGAESYVLLDAGIPVDSGAGSTLLLISILLLVFFAAYLTTKFIASRGRGTGRGRFIQVKESVFVGRDKNVMLLEAGGKYYLVGVTNQNMQLLGTMEKDELQDMQEETDSGGALGFKSAWMRLVQNAQNAKNVPEQLKKARAQFVKEQQEAPAFTQEATAEEAPIPEKTGLHLLNRLPGKTQRQKTEMPQTQKDTYPNARESGEISILQENSFRENLSNASQELVKHEQEPMMHEKEVIVELSQAAEQQPALKKKWRATENKRAPQKSKEDEIDKMMQSIEQRTQQLKDKYARDDTHARE